MNADQTALLASIPDTLRLRDAASKGPWETYDGSLEQNLKLEQFTHIAAGDHIVSTEYPSDAAFIANAHTAVAQIEALLATSRMLALRLLQSDVTLDDAERAARDMILNLSRGAR